MYKAFIFLHIIFLPASLEILACASDPCQNGATCFDHNGVSSYVCLCPAGFEGTHCENGTLSVISSFSITYLLSLIVLLHKARRYSRLTQHELVICIRGVMRKLVVYVDDNSFQPSKMPCPSSHHLFHLIYIPMTEILPLLGMWVNSSTLITMAIGPGSVSR